MTMKDFYEEHWNFSHRNESDYFISPGTKCKFDLIKENIRNSRCFQKSVDLGCSGNSFLDFMKGIEHKSFFDLANLPLKQYKTRYSHPLCGDAYVVNSWTDIPSTNNIL